MKGISLGIHIYLENNICQRLLLKGMYLLTLLRHRKCILVVVFSICSQFTLTISSSCFILPTVSLMKVNPLPSTFSDFLVLFH